MRSGLDWQINLWGQRFNRSIEHRKKLANKSIPLWPNQAGALALEMATSWATGIAEKRRALPIACK